MADTLLNNFFVQSFFPLVLWAWFLWIPIVLFLVFKDAWRAYVRTHFIFTKKYILLEIKVPREVAKSPKAMESILAGIHGTRRMGNMLEQWWDGWITSWFSFEIVGDERGVHFYIWTNAFFKRMLESQIYAQYPSAEVREVEDYTKSMPEALPNDEWNLFGSELVLTKPDAYPIKTYEEFTLEKVSVKEEGTKIDPLAALMEFLGVLKGSERIWIQMLVEPADDKWKKEGDALMAKIVGKEIKSKPTLIGSFIGAIDGLIGAALSFNVGEPVKKSPTQFPRMMALTPGERETVESVEKNMAKLGFKVCIRWMYLAHRNEYNLIAVPGIMGVFKQFASQNLNSFGLNKKITTSIDYWFVNRRVTQRRIWLYNSYRLRSVFHPPYNAKSRPFILSTSELATVYHFPGEVAAAPAFERIEAKRGAPPPNLPI